MMHQVGNFIQGNAVSCEYYLQYGIQLSSGAGEMAQVLATEA